MAQVLSAPSVARQEAPECTIVVHMASMEGKKRARQDPDALVALARGAHVSQSALEEKSQHMRDQGVPSASSRRTQGRARSKCANVETPFGACVKDLELPEVGVQVAVQDPFAMLWQTAHKCENFRTALLEAMQKSPPTPTEPWSLIFYFDEVTPNNPLARGKDVRNVQNVYWSFLELGDLWNHNRWFVAATVRAHVVEKMPGGMSRFFGLIYNEFFDAAAGNNFRTTGCAIDVGSTVVHLFAVHRATIADFKGHCQVLCSMGANALKPCPICRNIVNHAQADVELKGPNIRPLDCLEHARWIEHLDDSCRALAEKLRTMAANLGDVEKMHGYRCNEHSIVLRADYAPVSTLLFDWQHIWCQNGVYERALNTLMECIHEMRKGARGRKELPTFADYHEYLQAWSWPSHVREASRVCETGRLSGTSSEVLSAAPVLAYFFQFVVEPLGGLSAEIQSFRLASDVMDLLMALNRSAEGSPAELLEATLAFLRSHKRVHDNKNWVYKFHQSIHLPIQWERLRAASPHLADVGLCSCFALERKHKDVKKHLKDKLNTMRERTVMEDLTLDHWHYWNSEFCAPNELLKPRQPSRAEAEELQELAVAPAEALEVSLSFLCASGEGLARGDFVLLGGGAGGIVRLFARSGVGASVIRFVVVETFDLKRYHHPSRSAKFVRSPLVRCHDVRSIRGACIHKIAGEVLTALVPWHLQKSAM